MATFMPHDGKAVQVTKPLTLGTLQAYVQGFIRFIDLTSGDILVVNENTPPHIPVNTSATAIAGFEVRGDAVLCSPEEID